MEGYAPTLARLPDDVLAFIGDRLDQDAVDGVKILEGYHDQFPRALTQKRDTLPYYPALAQNATPSGCYRTGIQDGVFVPPQMVPPTPPSPIRSIKRVNINLPPNNPSPRFMHNQNERANSEEIVLRQSYADIINQWLSTTQGRSESFRFGSCSYCWSW